MISEDIRTFLARIFLGKARVRSLGADRRSVSARGLAREVDTRPLRPPQRALGSTLFLASRKTTRALLGGVMAGCLLAAVSLVAFGLARTLSLALPAMVALGFGISVCNVGINMLLQIIAPDTLRGRVVSFFTSARFGFDALGGLLAGFVANSLGASATMIAEGVVLLGFVLFLRTRQGQLAALIEGLRKG